MRSRYGSSIIIADPGFEQIAENVERLGALARVARKSMNCAPAAGSAGIQMQIGDEQRVQGGSLGAG
jgi:hypothetical protein